MATNLTSMLRASALAASTAVLLATGCGYNTVIEADEDVKATWSEVQNQYKRRSDLVPNLVQVLKGAADFEQKTLQAVVEARSKVSSMQVGSEVIDNPERLKAFEQAQQQLSGALSRLMVVVERYPDLKASANYRDLQAQLEGTENRIAVARTRYIASVGEYNKIVLRFPSSIGAKWRGKKVRPTFSVDERMAEPPQVNFGADAS